jgi:hypothetical protein
MSLRWTPCPRGRVATTTSQRFGLVPTIAVPTMIDPTAMSLRITERFYTSPSRTRHSRSRRSVPRNTASPSGESASHRRNSYRSRTVSAGTSLPRPTRSRGVARSRRSRRLARVERARVRRHQRPAFGEHHEGERTPVRWATRSERAGSRAFECPCRQGEEGNGEDGLSGRSGRPRPSIGLDWNSLGCGGDVSGRCGTAPNPPQRPLSLAARLLAVPRR